METITVGNTSYIDGIFVQFITKTFPTFQVHFTEIICVIYHIQDFYSKAIFMKNKNNYFVTKRISVIFLEALFKEPSKFSVCEINSNHVNLMGALSFKAFYTFNEFQSNSNFDLLIMQNYI